MTVSQFSPERVAARQEIEHRVHQFARAIDRLDFEGAREAFHDDAIDDHGAYRGDVDGLLAWVEKRHETLPFSTHGICNIYIEFAGDDDAFCESYILGWQSVTPSANLSSVEAQSPDEMIEMITNARYVDHFTRRNGSWRIQRRTVVFGSAMVVPVPASGKIGYGPDATYGVRDETDPAEALRKELGLRS
ncbi:MAG: nuclear transport factor 2 family protein [Hyphomicrobiales bacterium]|nr:MAG: nuclear transport factor 2 family protein [Hyphomicrobiales bacterium]